MTDAQAWEKGMGQQLAHLPRYKALALLAALRAAWRKPTAADSIYINDIGRFSPLCGPEGQDYEAALARLEAKYSAEMQQADKP